MTIFPHLGFGWFDRVSSIPHIWDDEMADEKSIKSHSWGPGVQLCVSLDCGFSTQKSELFQRCLIQHENLEAVV